MLLTLHFITQSLDVHSVVASQVMLLMALEKMIYLAFGRFPILHPLGNSSIGIFTGLGGGL